MRDLTAPLRLTWDLPGDPELAVELWRRIAKDRLLFVELHVTPNALGDLSALADGIAWPGVPRLSLLADLETLVSAVEVLGPRLASGTELLALPPYESRPRFGALAAAGHRPIPSVWSTIDGLHHFAQVLDLAQVFRLASVAVLNPPAPAAALTPQARDRATSEWSRRHLPGVELRVHDLFLAEALGLEPFRNYAGCQAGGASAHLTGRGELSGCRTLQRKLGNLLESSFRELWSDDVRRALRDDLDQAPDECTSCTLAASCKGGCRGLSSDLGRDPSCADVRGGGS